MADYNWDDFVESAPPQTGTADYEVDEANDQGLENEEEEVEEHSPQPKKLKYILPSGCSKKDKKHDLKKADKASASDTLTPETTKRIIVLNLPNKTPEHEVRQFFSSCGTVLAVQNRIGAATPMLKGIALVTFSSNEEMRKAVETLDATPFDERILKVRPHTTSIATPKKAESSTTIFVGNIDFTISRDELAAAFKHCGQILSVSLFYFHY